MLKPICVPCQRFFRPERNGFHFIEGKPDGNKVPPGTAEPSLWSPYKHWCGDLWLCHGCGQKIILGTGRQPVAEYWQRDFNVNVKAFHADQFQVNDC